MKVLSFHFIEEVRLLLLFCIDEKIRYPKRNARTDGTVYV